MEKVKIRTLATPKRLNRSSQKVACLIKSWTALDTQRFVAIGLEASAPQIREFDVLRRWLDLMFVFRVLAPRYSLNQWRFLRKIRHKTSFRWMMCLLGLRWLNLIFRPPFWGPQFWPELQFFVQLKIALTWGCSNINYS